MDPRLRGDDNNKRWGGDNNKRWGYTCKIRINELSAIYQAKPSKIYQNILCKFFTYRVFCAILILFVEEMPC